MAGRVKRGRGRLMESVGALTDYKGMKDKGRLLQGEGTARSAADRARRLLGKVRGK
jgi:uncharacterized protein YjbJ (UPF0337 family)